MDKRGLSTVVATLIIILLVMVATGVVWVVIRNVISEGAEEISLGKLTISLEIKSVDIKNDSVDVRVKRNAGAGDLIAIKFIVSDGKNSDIVEKETNMKELEEELFTILPEDLNYVNISNITSISIAPILVSGSGERTSGGIIYVYNVGSGGGNGNGGPPEPPPESECDIDEDCGTDGWIGSEYCGGGGNVWQGWIDYTCSDGVCGNTTTPIERIDCNETDCTDGECVGEDSGCIDNSSCGIDGWTGTLICIGNESWQNYTTYLCSDGNCSNSTTLMLKQNCTLDGKICGINGECYEYVECSVYEDCDIGKMCVDSLCVNESKLNYGTVNTVWPPGVAEYFDSPDLTQIDGLYTGYYVGFTSGSEDRCLQIAEHIYSAPNNAYIRFSVTSSNVSSGNGYEVWETEYNCDNFT